MFPLSIEGAIDLPADINDPAYRLTIALRAVEAKDIQPKSERLLFRGLSPVATSWNVMIFFDQCELSIAAGKVNYKCSTKYFLILVTVIMLGFGFLTSLSSKSTSSLVGNIAFFVVGWLFLFGLNYWNASVRFPRFLERMLDEKLA